MIIIAFSAKTSKILPKIFCRHFRHCCPILPRRDKNNAFILYQFVSRRHTEEIPISIRGIGLLKMHGWEFVCLPDIKAKKKFLSEKSYTCVQLTKKALSMHAPFIQTPDRLFRKIKSTPKRGA